MGFHAELVALWSPSIYGMMHADLAAIGLILYDRLNLTVSLICPLLQLSCPRLAPSSAYEIAEAQAHCLQEHRLLRVRARQDISPLLPLEQLLPWPMRTMLCRRHQRRHPRYITTNPLQVHHPTHHSNTVVSHMKRRGIAW